MYFQNLPRINAYNDLKNIKVDMNKEDIASQARRVESMILKKYMLGHIYFEWLHDDLIQALKDLGYRVRFHSPSIYPPTWLIYWPST